MLQWPNATLFEAMAGIADRHPMADALVFEDERTAYGELLDESRALAASLSRRGVEAGDTVGIWLANRPEWVTTQLACSYLGAAVVAINTRYRAHELEYLLGDAGCRALVIEHSLLGRDYRDLLAEVVPEIEAGTPGSVESRRLPELSAILTVGEADEAYPVVEAYREVIDGERETPEPADDPSAPACLFYTSGTTSDPKGCPQSNRSVLNHSHQVGVHLGVGEDDIALGALPFCGVWGYNAFLSALVHGIPLVVEATFDPGETIDLIEAHGVSYYSALATMHERLIDHDSFERERVSSLERGSTGFLTMRHDEGLFERFEAELRFPLVQTYGLSEANSQVFVGDREDSFEQRARPGGPLIHPSETFARVVDPETDEPRGPNEEGELLLGGYNVFGGYHGKPDATAAAFLDDHENGIERWFRTGDLVTRDEDGYLYFASRLDDALRVRGFLVTPYEIERAIDDCPGVGASQVVGTPHPHHGQVPVAFVKRTNLGADERGLIDFLDGRIADYKIPEAIEFVEAFPRTDGPNGAKVSKEELRSRVVDRFQ